MKSNPLRGFSRWLFALSGVFLSALTLSADGGYFKIRVVDDQTGRGVPLVELCTTAQQKFFTDSAGLIAFNEPGLMGEEVWFGVKSDGYEFSKDGFGYAGVRLRPVAGKSAEIRIKRVNVAERLYRITGAGIYRDSVLLGEKTPLARPVLNGGVLGQDSSVPVVYRGRIHWFWGDTTRAGYPLGNFHVSGAVSELPAMGHSAASAGIDLEYFADERGFSRAMAPLPAPGAVWIAQPIVLMRDGREAMLTHYSRVKTLGEQLEHGLMFYDDAKDQFVKLRELDSSETWRFPAGRPVRWNEGETSGAKAVSGQEGGAHMDYFVFANPFATVRVKADWASATETAAYEAFTCLSEESTVANPVVARDAAGRVLWQWRANAEPLGQKRERELVERGVLAKSEARYQLCDAESGKAVEMHHASIHWNAFSKRWILIGVEMGGRSFLGEVWFAAAKSPFGPWRTAVRIATHEKYSFYNPSQLPFFDEDGGRFVYFEGTYSSMFSGNSHPTALYDYNQLMYRLDLSDARLRAALE